jgi:hypothetical protein
MKRNNSFRWLLIIAFAWPVVSHSQVSNDTGFFIRDLTSFDQPDKSWTNVADIIINPNKPGSYKKIPGSGILLADATKTESYLTTQMKFDDTEIEFDFLVDKGAVCAIFVQGRYRLNLSDSWAETKPSFNSMGGIGQQKAQDVSGFSGAVPFVNVAKAPGLWQHVKLRFRANQFINGRKTRNALFEEVYINGSLVQQNMELQGSSIGSTSTSEESTGPVVFYSSKGVLALKNIKISKPALPTPTVVRPGPRRFRVTNPIIITPEETNYLLRSFLNIGTKKKTHVISVGSPGEMNYSYDMKQGALLQVWNGPFVDATEMWEQRGEPQLVKPLGSVIPLSENPALAVLSDATTPWPDSISFEAFKNMGYTLDKQRNPGFEYETGGYHVLDKVSFHLEDRSLMREINVTNIPSNLYCRIANGSAINSLGKGWYVIGDKSYYIRIDQKLKPIIRHTSQGAELILLISEKKPLSYSVIW